MKSQCSIIQVLTLVFLKLRNAVQLGVLPEEYERNALVNGMVRK